MRWEKRLWNAFLAEVVESRRDVLLDRRQQLCGGETRIDVQSVIEFLFLRGCLLKRLVRLLCDFQNHQPSTFPAGFHIELSFTFA